MAVRSRKYSRKYILCTEIFVQCAEKLYSAWKSCNPPNIYYLCPKHLYECANILTCAEILSLPAEIYSLCAETYLLRAEIYMLRGNTFKSPQFFLFVHGNYYVPCADFGLPTILGMPSSRD